MIMYGLSTGHLPIQVNMMKFLTISQNRTCDAGRNVMDVSLEVCNIGMTNNIRMDSARAITPPNLFGIDRKIA